jgi:CHAT domain-containing protein
MKRSKLGGAIGLVLMFVSVTVALFIHASHEWSVRESARLILEAYGEQRTLELRIGTTRHAFVRVKRGQSTSSSLDQPLPLLEAQAEIGRLLRHDPDRPAFLSLRGRAALLDWSYEAAITDLQKALWSDPKSPERLSDLASAYFERAERNNSFEDYGMAFELQSQALETDNDNPVVVFNRGITAEHLFLFTQSERDWEHYLRLDTSGDWSDEARQRLAKVRSLLADHDLKITSALLTPAEFADRVDPIVPATWEQVDQRIEDYLSMAISEWVPSLHSGDGKPTLRVRQALTTLAIIMKQNHGDIWLSDLLSDPATPGLSEGVSSLARAIAADSASDDYASGRVKSQSALRSFRSANSHAGMARSTLEEATAFHFSDAASECLSAASEALSVAQSHKYLSIQVQSELELYNCSALMSQFDRSREFAARAYKTAIEHHYSGLAIRAMTFLAHAEYSRGHREQGWRICQNALQKYWSDGSPSSRAYGLYVVMDVLSQTDEKWHLDFAIGSEGMTFIAKGEEPLMRAEEYTNLAHAATMAGELQTATGELNLAVQALDSAVRSDVTDNYRFDTLLFLAWIQGRSNPDDGIRLLDSLKARLFEMHNETLAAKYYLARGELLAAKGDLSQADRELSLAVYFGERQRSSLKSELDRASWVRGSEEPYEELADVKQREQDSSGGLAVLELYRGAAVRAENQLSATIKSLMEGESSTNGLQEILVPEAALVSRVLSESDKSIVLIYSVSSRGLGIWVYSNHVLSFHSVDRDPRYLRMLAMRFGELCSQPSSSIDSVRATAHQLYDALIDPVADQIHAGRPLLIEPGPSLSQVPFQALLDRSGRYLADDHAILLSPGLRYVPFGSSLDHGVNSDSEALIVASEAGGVDSGLRPVTNALSEANRTSEHFRHPQLLVGDQASLDNLDSMLPRAEVFHFAGHAGMSNGEMGLLLRRSQTDPLTGVFSAPLLHIGTLPNLKIAVLSACSTEVSNPGTLDPQGLARAILRAGAADVVASRWDVDSKATEMLMTRFYDLMLTGHPVSEALNGAELSLRQQYSHPYYWAAFDVFGKN